MRMLVSLVLLLVSQGVVADDRALAREYVKARCSTLTRGATDADVDRVVALMTEDVVIEHPKFGAVVRGREAVRQGMASHLTEYTGTSEESGIVLLESIESPGAVALRTRTTFVVGEGANRKVIDREGLTVVEIKDGRIRRLIEF